MFQTGTPVFRKYDAKGELLYERHIEGLEIDDQVRTLPTVWRARNPGDDRQPIAIPLVRTAAVDRLGRLWISLVVPFTYVYERGDKVRTVQFEGAGTMALVVVIGVFQENVCVDQFLTRWFGVNARRERQRGRNRENL